MNAEDKVKAILSASLLAKRGFLKTLWESFRDTMLTTKDYPPEMVECLRIAFYGGMCGVFKTIDDMPPVREVADIVLQSLSREIEEFLDEFTSKPKSEDEDSSDSRRDCPCPICSLLKLNPYAFQCSPSTTS